jgi:hypothetical protein
MILCEWKSIFVFTFLIAYFLLATQLPDKSLYNANENGGHQNVSFAFFACVTSAISLVRLSTISTGMSSNDCHLTLVPTQGLIFCDSKNHSDPPTLHFAGDELSYLAGWMRFLDQCIRSGSGFTDVLFNDCIIPSKAQSLDQD